MRFFTRIVIFGLLLGLAPASALGLTLELISRDENSLGQEPPQDDDGAWLFNLQDCLDRDKIKFRFEVTDDEAYPDRDLVIYAGTNCKSAPDGDSCEIFDVNADGTLDVTLGNLFPYRFDGDTPCADGFKEAVFASRVENENARETGTFQDSVEDITIDGKMDAPPTLTGIDAEPGDGRVIVSWEASGADGDTWDEEIEQVYVVIFGGDVAAAGDADTSAAAAADPGDTDTGDADTGDADTGDTGASGDSDSTSADAGTGPAARIMIASPPPAESADDECPPGGFVAGDAFSTAYAVKKDTSPSGLSLSINDLTNDVPYKFGVISVDKYRNTSPISTTVCATPRESIDFFEVYSKAGGKGGKFCFVATAAFGSYDHPTVRILRRFRDEFLEPMPGGRHLIHAYYEVGPDAALAIDRSDALKTVVRGALTVVAALSVPLTRLGPFGAMLVSALFLGAVVYRRRRRR